ncbi:hypothetical protein T265_07063 [Opisthorchis viverrini]|uniref:Uncharacterized protein n=1 Tax=Opisthorchis viverrini TaxID=6198 RepID=A0A075ACK7_OPIVI|nr:hypothetical protein T265_07063 [Opisthorchis viverrini]KER25494.1 hypothetical protein T265_07063 [Opisthorchis viverrini]
MANKSTAVISSNSCGGGSVLAIFSININAVSMDTDGTVLALKESRAPPPPPLGGISHGSHFATRSQVLLRPRSISHARLVENSGLLPVRHQTEILLVESLDPTDNHDLVLAECRLPMPHPEGVRISRKLPPLTLYV